MSILSKEVLSQKIKTIAKAQGFHSVGLTSADPLKHASIYNQWIEKKYFGEMDYLKRHQEKKSDLKRVFPGAQSVVCLALSYKTKNQNPISEASNKALISNYAWGDDYHIVIEKKLKALLEEIKKIDASVEGRFYVDSGPVLERSLAWRAGIGWVGKNTMVMNQAYGSYIFLAELLMNKPLVYDTSQSDHCGTCTKCIEACPTDALVGPYELDARKCISYLTIEKRGELSKDESNMLGAYVFGCDICQVVCPWNNDAVTPDLECFRPRPGNFKPDVQTLQWMTQQDFSEKFTKSPVKRTKFKGLMRNVMIRAGLSA